MVSKASDDLPEPESPVNTTSWSRGISTSISLRLCSRAPRIAITRALSRAARGGAGRRGRLWSKRSFMQSVGAIVSEREGPDAACADLGNVVGTRAFRQPGMEQPRHSVYA